MNAQERNTADWLATKWCEAYERRFNTAPACLTFDEKKKLHECYRRVDGLDRTIVLFGTFFRNYNMFERQYGPDPTAFSILIQKIISLSEEDNTPKAPDHLMNPKEPALTHGPPMEFFKLKEKILSDLEKYPPYGHDPHREIDIPTFSGVPTSRITAAKQATSSLLADLQKKNKDL